jgi:hypothetical protein
MKQTLLTQTGYPVTHTHTQFKDEGWACLLLALSPSVTTVELRRLSSAITHSDSQQIVKRTNNSP